MSVDDEHGIAQGLREALAAAPQPPAEAQAQGDRLAIKLLVAAGYVTEAKANEALNIAHGFDKGPLAPPSEPDVAMEAWHSAVDNAAELRANAPDERYAKRAASVESWIKANRPTPPSAPLGVETVDAAAWIEVLELPEGFRVAEHLPGIWEYQFDIEDEADEDSDRKVSGASWNHPALAAIAAWGHAYDAVSQQPAAVDGAWRQKAAEWLEAKAVEQEANNQRWPDHAAAYKEWRDRPGVLRYLAAQVLAAQPGGANHG